MKANKFFIGMASLVAAMTFTACSQDEAELQQSSYNKGNVISLAYQLAQTRAASDPQTSALSTSNKVGVFVTSGSTTITNGNNNEHSVGAAGVLTTSNTMNYPTEDGAKVNIYAYAPYASGMALSSDNNFSVSTDQSAESGYLASDLIYAKATPTDQKTVNLAFAHKLSRIVLTLQTDEGTSLTDATIKIVGTKPSTVFTLTDGSIGTATGTAADITIGSGISVGASSSTTLYGVIVPQTISANTTLIEVTAGGKAWRYHFSSDAVFVGGKSHSASITVSSNSFTSTIGGNATEPAN